MKRRLNPWLYRLTTTLIAWAVVMTSCGDGEVQPVPATNNPQPSACEGVVCDSNEECLVNAAGEAVCAITSGGPANDMGTGSNGIDDMGGTPDGGGPPDSGNGGDPDMEDLCPDGRIPLASEICGNGVDDDCNGVTDGPNCPNLGECEEDIPAPRLIAPMSTNRVTTQRPTLRWENAAGADGSIIQICADSDCAAVISEFDSDGETGRPDAALDAGAVFWRAYGTSGDAVGCASSRSWSFTVPHADSPVDTSWIHAPDLNADGFSDLVVGAPAFREEPDEARGIGYVYLGSTDGLRSQPQQSLKNPSPRTQRLSGFGNEIAYAGDINGDGYGDVIFGAQYEDNRAADDEPPNYRGRAFVFYGSTRGLDADSVLELSGEDSGNGTQGFGEDAAGLGDIDGDGYGDIAITSSQKLYIYRGSASGVDTSSRVTLNVNTSATQVISAGDVNGDGYADMVVANPQTSNFSGDAELFLGSAQGFSNRSNTTMQDPEDNGFGMGFSAALAGDINGDGYADLVMGGPGSRNGGLDGSAAFFFLGSATGLPSEPSTVRDFQAEGLGAVGFGRGVTGIGDIDADGLDDVIVLLDNSALGPGRGYIYTGTMSGPADTAFSFQGTGGNTFGGSNAALGDFNGDGFSDYVVGTPPDAVQIFSGSMSAPTDLPSQSLLRAAPAEANFGWSLISHAERP